MYICLHTKVIESFRGGVGPSFCEGSRPKLRTTPDKSLIEVEDVSSGISCPVVKLVASHAVSLRRQVQSRLSSEEVLLSNFKTEEAPN